MAAIGSIIENKYEILKLVGQGGMSKVYLAMDQNLNKQWAVKEIEKKTGDKNNDIVAQSAMAEANMIKKLDHPALPRIVDIVEKETVIYVIMDYIEGEPLNEVLQKYGAQPQDTVIEWAKQLCRVLDYLHTCTPPIIYRDMKPANIILQPNGNIKLIDFGIAREYKKENLADTVSLGTRGYAAPEQFGGKGQTDARTDIYCLGVTLYHLLTGQNPCEPPYELYPLRYWNPALSGGLENIILRCTRVNPRERYQSCAEVLYALNHYNELDEAYRKKQKSKLHAFQAVAAAGILSLAVGIAGQTAKWYVNNSDYDNTILQAETAANDVGRIASYLKAMEVKPTDSRAYFGIIQAFKDDAVFTVEEEEQFKKQINTNLESLRKNEDYARLAFETGKLYWYYYDYGKTDGSDNQITRMKSAVQWFEDAVEYGTKTDDYYLMAQTYGEIGKFNRDITLNVEEASDKGLYVPYWENIKKLIRDLEQAGEENEIVKLEAYRLGMYSIETYSRKFKGDGVTKEEMEQVLEDIKKNTNEVETTTEKTESIKQQVMERYEAARNVLEHTFAERQGSTA